MTVFVGFYVDLLHRAINEFRKVLLGINSKIERLCRDLKERLKVIYARFPSSIATIGGVSGEGHVVPYFFFQRVF